MIVGLSAWTEWSDCARSNDVWTKTRTRKCISGSSGNNSDCTEALSDDEPCLPTMDLIVYAGSKVHTIVVNGKRFGAKSGAKKFDVPMKEGETILRLEYGTHNYLSWVDYSLAICELVFVTNIQKHGPFVGKVMTT